MGTKLRRTKGGNEDRDGSFEQCLRTRNMKKSIVIPPTLLFVEALESVEVHQRRSHLKGLNQLEHQLVIGENQFQLIAVILGNGAHWCGITLIHGKYLLYNGMLRGKRLR